jgi:hypothetical protein
MEEDDDIIVVSENAPPQVKP